ncbi:hypothetical protein X943_002460 [Babesia divergens]|uniref:Uncharacterized protein n=1 Tax=Babesia divergens TaxID=32595 RepID=A0AAD9GDI8_BABDI|nr:hypothetical protein X943_002460 [Babesia divergens]
MQTRRSRASIPFESTTKRVCTDVVKKTESAEDSVPQEAAAKFFTATDVNKNSILKDDSKPVESGGMGEENGHNKDSKLLSHWLFSDEGPGFKLPKIGPRGFQSSSTSTFSSSSLFTSAAKVTVSPVQDVVSSETSQELSTSVTARETTDFTRTAINTVPTALTFPAGRSSPSISSDGIRRIKGMLDLDSTTHSDTNESEHASCQATKRDESAGLLEHHYTTTDKVVDYVDATQSHRVTALESWCRNCVLTNHDGSSLSPSMLSRMWNIYGNPFTVTYTTSAKFTFIKYSACEDSITVGGINEIYQCFKQIIRQHAEQCMELQRFDAEWLRNKYCLFVTAECNRFRRAVYKLVRRGRELKDAILEVQLPSPLTVIKKILWCFNQEFDGKESILLRILHGDAPADSPVVVRVESIQDDDVCITDGQSILRCIAADCYVKQLLKDRRIIIGNKIQLHGIAIDADASKDEAYAVVKLNFNSISPAPKKSLGLQKRHNNGHIRELKGGAGKVAQLDVTVLGVMPPMFKVFYKPVDSSRSKWMFLSEWEFNEQFADPMIKPPFQVENVHVLQALSVIDTIILLRIKDYLQDPLNFQKSLVKSCALLTIKNVDETVMSMIRPGSRLKITDLIVQNTSTVNRPHSAMPCKSYIGNYLSFHSTMRSRMDIKDRDTPLNQIRHAVSAYKQGVKGSTNQGDDGAVALGEAKSIFRTLILGEPALSISSHNETEFFDLLHERASESDDYTDEMFLDQFCNVTGVLLDVGDIINVGENWRFFRFFILTTCFKIVAVKVAARCPYPSTNEGAQQNACALLAHTHRRLMAQKLTIAKAPEANSKKNKCIFVVYMNLQYAGFDHPHSVYNFNTTAGRVVMKESQILQKLQTRMQDGLIFTHGTGNALSYDAVAALGDKDIDRDCRAFTRCLARAKLKIYHLLNSGGEDVKLCEDVLANIR